MRVVLEVVLQEAMAAAPQGVHLVVEVVSCAEVQATAA